MFISVEAIVITDVSELFFILCDIFVVSIIWVVEGIAFELWVIICVVEINNVVRIISFGGIICVVGLIISVVLGIICVDGLIISVVLVIICVEGGINCVVGKVINVVVGINCVVSWINSVVGEIICVVGRINYIVGGMIWVVNSI